MIRDLHRLRRDLEAGACVILVRYRPADLVAHEFCFQRVKRSGEEQYTCNERFDGDGVQEDMYTLESVEALIYFLLRLKFEINYPEKEKSQ